MEGNPPYWLDIGYCLGSEYSCKSPLLRGGFLLGAPCGYPVHTLSPYAYLAKARLETASLRDAGRRKTENVCTVDEVCV
jgi:hypothetical protein